MCGISGFISPHAIDAKLLADMTNVSKYRGPDGEGYAVFGNSINEAALADNNLLREKSKFDFNIGLGHRRLAIIDLSTDGLQPLKYRNRFLITFNGEIFNYKELREELKQLGHHFQTQTDTEVACAAIAEWGIESFNKMNGMWAIVFVDCLKGDVIISRDRFGIKPLYYLTSQDGTFFFSSEAKQLLQIDKKNPSLNHEAAASFLGYGLSDYSEATFFKGIYELRGGQFLRFHLSTLPRPIAKTWYLPDLSPLDLENNQLINRFSEIFDSSISLRLRADVPIGSCLSGGLDSSSIVETIYRKLTNPNGTSVQNTFSFIPNDEKFSERKYIDFVLSGKNLNSHIINPSPSELEESLDAIAFHQDFPFASTSILAQWFVFKNANQNGVKVMLDGQGADEILGGYHSFFKVHLYSLFKNLQFGKFKKECVSLHKNHQYGLNFILGSLALGLLPYSIEKILRNILRENNGHPEYLHKNFHIDNPRSYRKMNICSIKDLSLDQIKRSNLPMLLRYEDRNSMAHGIEARVPFLDYRLVEFSLRLPVNQIINEGMTKVILRKSMEKNLSHEIVFRKDKMGFITPEETWFKNNPNFFKTILNNSVVESSELFSKKLSVDFEKFIKGEIPYSQAFWRVISFGLWKSKFKVSI